MKECPLCGEPMRLDTRQVTDAVPGQARGTVHAVREWVCPECDYFEEAETGEA